MQRGKDGGRSKQPKSGARRFDDGFDASPNDLRTVEDAGKNGLRKTSGKPKNIMETKAWQESTGGARRFWHNYVNNLSTHFQRMNRKGQEELITRLSQIISIGTAVITMSAWYWFLPQGFRVIALPIIIVGSWWVGTRIVAPAMIARFEKYLNKDDDDSSM
jgi:hypothetical protein